MLAFWAFRHVLAQDFEFELVEEFEFHAQQFNEPVNQHQFNESTKLIHAHQFSKSTSHQITKSITKYHKFEYRTSQLKSGSMHNSQTPIHNKTLKIP